MLPWICAQSTRGGDRTHNLRLRKPTRFHCATRALHKTSHRLDDALFLHAQYKQAKAQDVPKRLRGWTRNPLGSARAGSSPAVCVLPHFGIQQVLCTHAAADTCSVGAVPACISSYHDACSMRTHLSPFTKDDRGQESKCQYIFGGPGAHTFNVLFKRWICASAAPPLPKITLWRPGMAQLLPTFQAECNARTVGMSAPFMIRPDTN